MFQNISTWSVTAGDKSRIQLARYGVVGVQAGEPERCHGRLRGCQTRLGASCQDERHQQLAQSRME